MADYQLTTPDENVIRTENGTNWLTKFCKMHDLLQPKMTEVMKGTRPRHKGWTRHV